jgi:dephospho-CoA kinase/inosine/xanthosine triphosphate pyrophosphatase family protein
VFFVEDTSLRLEALSDADDYPGLRVKEWFKETSFEELERQIQLRRGDRRAVVMSDIALKLPGLSRPIFFHGETRGAVASTPPTFEPSVQYPWLTPHTFNGWFIPEGATKRLGEMEFEESLAYDFRAKSLIELVKRLEELSASLNIGRANYYVRREDTTPAEQLSLLPYTSTPIYIVVGHKCAGKTTFSDCVAESDGVMALEGSTILREIADRQGIEINGSSDAYAFLEANGFDIVAREISTYIQREEARTYVVSGMRTIEEVEHLIGKFPSARLVWIEADQQDRFERHIKRARDLDVKTSSEFRRQDESQMHFGVLRAGPEIADNVLRNDESLEAFRHKIRQFVERPGPRRLRLRSRSELHRCLVALSSLNRAATCEEISQATAETGVRVRRYNTNRALKDVPEFAQRIEPKGGKLLRYRITDRGQRLLKLLER